MSETNGLPVNLKFGDESIPAQLVQVTDMSVEDVMRYFGVDRLKAEFILGLERGETTGDVVAVEEPLHE